MPHDHDHHPSRLGRTFAVGVALNVGFVLIEAFYGWHIDSLALLADAAHNLSDVGGLILAWGAQGALRLRPDARHTYGWRRGTIMASFANAIIVLAAMGSLAWEAIGRLQSPSVVDAATMMAVAAVGIVINAATAALFLAGSKSDLNLRGAFLHMAADTLVSTGVVAAGGLYLWGGWGWIDPAVSLAIAAIIVVATGSLFRQSLHLLFDGVPESIALADVRQSLKSLPGVVSVHDLHVWALATSENALTAHLVIDDGAPPADQLLRIACDVLHDRFEIRHATLQLESRRYAGTCSSVDCG